MSTDRKRLTSAIQRIAREDTEIRKLLDDFRNSGGKPSESATSGSGAEDRQICCDGSSPNNPNPGSDTRDPNENPQDGIDPDDPANISDNLSGVTDCVSGDPICFEGSGWIPPEGWEDIDSPPDYSPGEYYEVGGVKRPSPCQAWNDATYPANFSDGILVAAPGCYTIQRIFELDRIKYFYTRIYNDGTEEGPLEGEVYVSRFDCGGDAGDYCTNPEKYIEWPKDSCVNLAIKGGKIVGSKFDPENDGTYSAPRNSIELCDEFGNSFELSPSASGGWKSISSQNPDDGYLYDSTGEQIARISESEYSDPNV